ncbi:MAG: LysR family transcriptional regulator [Burkholderiales bacterium]|nr:LysR family transcriptional regulator [Burkholderiales bacterium]
MHNATDLNDLRTVAAVHQTGSLSGAARALGVNHATVFRRVIQLEKELGVRLFERSSGRYVATPAGEELAAAGAAMLAVAEQSLLKVAGRDLRPSGVVRITSTDSVAKALLNPIVALCRQRYPQITLQIVIDNVMLDLAKRDADIAVRPSLRPPEHLLGKRIAPLAFAVYGSQHYLAANTGKALEAHEWIALGEAQERHATVQWLQKIKPLDEVGCRIDGFAGMAQACADGLGLAMLPCFLGDSTARLRRMQAPEPTLASELWLLTHPDLRHTARIQSIYQTLLQELAQQAPLLAGERPA